MHSLDSGGRNYNKMGVLNKTWSKASIEQFDIKADYIKIQFSQYVLHGHKVCTNIYTNIYRYVSLI